MLGLIFPSSSYCTPIYIGQNVRIVSRTVSKYQSCCSSLSNYSRRYNQCIGFPILWGGLPSDSPRICEISSGTCTRTHNNKKLSLCVLTYSDDFLAALSPPRKSAQPIDVEHARPVLNQLMRQVGLWWKRGRGVGTVGSRWNNLES